VAFLGAGGVKLIDQLRDPLQQINTQGQNNLQGILQRIGTRQTASSKASGRVQGQYAPQELARSGGIASRGLEDTLAGALGGASLDEVRKQQEHQRNLALVRQIGDLMSPSILQQVLAGLGGGAKAGAQGYALYSALHQPTDPLANVYGNV